MSWIILRTDGLLGVDRGKASRVDGRSGDIYTHEEQNKRRLTVQYKLNFNSC